MLMAQGKRMLPPSSQILFARSRTHGYHRLILFLTPLLLCGVEIEHPILDRVHTISMLAPIATVWVGIHIALIPLFALMGWSFSLLLENVQGPMAMFSRWGAATWATFSIGYESAIGLTSGIVSSMNAHLSPSLRGIVQHALTAYLYSPIFNDMALFIILIGLGTVVVTFFALWRAGAPRTGTVLFLGSLFFAWAHESPFGPLGNFYFLFAAIVLELTWRVNSKQTPTSSDEE